MGLVVCRGCCCASSTKHPEIDHEARLDRVRRLAAAAPEVVPVKVSDCLGPCEYADVIVVTPTAAGRRNGARPVWFGFADDHALNLVCAWAASGGPGLAEMPDELSLHQIDRPRRAQQARTNVASEQAF